MKLKHVAIAVGLWGLLAMGARAADEWKEFKPDGGGFSVLMPGKLKEASQSTPSDLGPIESHLFFIETDGKTLAVGYIDFPEKAVSAKGADAVLDDARDGVIAQTKGKLLSQAKIKVDGNPGRDFLVEVPTGETTRSRIIMVKNRMHQLTSVGDKGHESSAAVNKMFDSFKLNGK